MSAVRKAIKAFGSYNARRAPAYVKGKTGYDAGFLPPRASPIRYSRPSASAEETARKSQANKSTDRTNSEIGEWKRQLSETRRSYMAEHITSEVENGPKRKEEIKARASKGRATREALLKAPQSEAELLSLPSIEQTIADEYPLRDENKEARERRRFTNRWKDEKIKEETRLHQLLTIHHNSSKYVTTLEGLDALLESKIGSAQYFDSVPKYRLQDLTGGPGAGSYSFSKVNELEAAIDDQIMGTAAGGKPGVVEISHILRNSSSHEQQPKESSTD